MVCSHVGAGLALRGRGLVRGGACAWEAAAARSSQGPRSDPGAPGPAELPGLRGLQAGERLEPGLGERSPPWALAQFGEGSPAPAASARPSAASPRRPVPVRCSALGVSVGAMPSLPGCGVRAHPWTSGEGPKLAGPERTGGAAPPFLPLPPSASTPGPAPLRDARGTGGPGTWRSPGAGSLPAPFLMSPALHPPAVRCRLSLGCGSAQCQPEVR